MIKGRDNETWISLTKSLNTIHALYGRDTEVPGGGEVDPEVATIYILLVLHSVLFYKIKNRYVSGCEELWKNAVCQEV
jgi:hypothetical protein